MVILYPSTTCCFLRLVFVTAWTVILTETKCAFNQSTVWCHSHTLFENKMSCLNCIVIVHCISSLLSLFTGMKGGCCSICSSEIVHSAARSLMLDQVPVQILRLCDELIMLLALTSRSWRLMLWFMWTCSSQYLLWSSFIKMWCCVCVCGGGGGDM